MTHKATGQMKVHICHIEAYFSDLVLWVLLTIYQLWYGKKHYFCYRPNEK